MVPTLPPPPFHYPRPGRAQHRRHTLQALYDRPRDPPCLLGHLPDPRQRRNERCRERDYVNQRAQHPQLRSSSRLSHVTIQTGTKHYMDPVNDPVRSRQLASHDPPFHESMPRLPYPNFYYALEDLIASYAPSLTYSVHRPTIIIGASTRSTHNGLLTLATYAAVCHHEGLPFRYPGMRYTWEHFCDMIDAGMLAEQHEWAAVTPQAKNEAFNCTNGDFFTWKKMWKVLRKEFVEYKEEEEFDLVEMMRTKGEVWEEIVGKHGLYKTKLEEIACYPPFQVVANFKFQHVSSMNKSKEYGFLGFAESFKSVRIWISRLRHMKIIP